MVQAGGLSSNNLLDALFHTVQYMIVILEFGIMVLLAVAPCRTQPRQRLDIRGREQRRIPTYEMNTRIKGGSQGAGGSRLNRASCVTLSNAECSNILIK